MKKKTVFFVKRIIALVLAFVMLFLCACYEGNEPQNMPQGSNANSISIGVYNFDTYNPIATVSHSVTQTSALIYDSLVKRKGDHSVEMCLASDYTISDGGLTYTFTLKDGITWHDGSEFNAADVEYTFKMITELEKSAYKNRISNIESFRRAGKNTFIITLYRPNGNFIALMDIPIIKSGTDCVNSLKEYIPIGTGAYKYVYSGLSRAMRLVRNENYITSQKPLIEEIIIKQLPSEELVSSALETREIEVASFSAAQMRNYNPKGNLSTVSYTNNALTFVGINTTVNGLDNSLIRRALSYALNRKQIAQDIFFGRAQAVNVPIAPDSYFSNPIYQYERDTERAITLLSDAGYSLDENNIMKNAQAQKLSFDLLVNLENELRISAAEKIKSDLAQIGVEIRIRKLSYSDYTNSVSEGEYEMFLGEVKLSDTLDLSALAGFGASYSIYESERIDSLLKRCRTAESKEIFKSTYNELAEVFLSEMPVIPIVMGTDVLVLNSKIKGVTPPCYENIFANTASWYVEY